MPRELVVKKNSQNVTIRPYNTPHEYFVITIEDMDGYNHFVEATKPYVYDDYNTYKKDMEEWKAIHIIAKELTEYISALEQNSDENLPIGEPLTCDLPDGRIVTAFHVNTWWVKSFYPPEIINAPTISKKIVHWWYHYDTRTMLTHGKSSTKGIVLREGK